MSSPGDATQPPLFLGSQKVNDLGLTTFTLDPFAVEALLRGGSILGITVLGSTDGLQYGFETLEWGGGSPPRLDIAYAVPEPSILLTFGATTLAFLARRRPRTGSPPRNASTLSSHRQTGETQAPPAQRTSDVRPAGVATTLPA